MKKMMIFLLIAVLVVTAGCGTNQAEPSESTTPETTVPVTSEPTEPPTEEPTEPPTEPKPDCTDAEVQADNAPAILMLLNRGDIVDIVGEFDADHYIVKTDSGYGMIEKQLLRLSNEAPYEGWVGYARYGAGLYESYQLTGEPLKKLNMNTQIQILDELDYCYVVQVDETTGFILKDEVSKSYIQYSGGGGSGGQDGGDISLNGGGIVMLSGIVQSGDVTGQAQVLADGAQVILGYYNRGDLAPVVTVEGFAPAWEGYHTLYIDGMYAYMPVNFALLEGEEAYAQWEGFAAYNSRVYDNYLLQGEGVRLSVNTVVTILWDGGDYYVVSIDGQTGYMAKDVVSETRHATGGGGGNSGGDWTPPAL